MSLALLLLSGSWSLASQAIDMTLTMRYRGQPDGRFENVTPPAAFCAVWPAACTQGNNYTADLPITYNKTIINQAPDIRDRHFIQMPGERQVEVVNDNGARYTLTFRIRALSQHLRRLTQNGRLAASARGGCQMIIGVSNTTRTQFRWSINNPSAPQACHEVTDTNLGLTNDVAVSQFGVNYELIMPRPIGMPQGIYRGSIAYSIGPGGEFDFGNAVTDLNASQLRVHFELDVQHDLYLQFPPGSDRAVLEPPGGWMAWLGGRGAPTRLYRDLPLRIWSTGPIKLYKRCQYELGGLCGLRENAGHMVPVQVAVTLPASMQHNGAPISKQAIPTREAAALKIEPTSTVWNQPGQLHFEVAGSDIPSMLDHPGSRYEGLVTVVFEAQL